MVIANEGKPVIIQCPQEQGFKLAPETLEAAITPKTLWLILNAPSNPTGAAYSRSELEALGKVLLRHPHVFVLSDDIYDQVWFRDEPMTTLVAAVPELKDRVLLTNGVSKSYAMTGWRIGYAAGPAPLVAAINKLQSQMSSCPSSISQAAAAHALSSDQSFVSESVKVYKERRDYACAGSTPFPACRAWCPTEPSTCFRTAPALSVKKFPRKDDRDGSRFCSLPAGRRRRRRAPGSCLWPLAVFPAVHRDVDGSHQGCLRSH